LYTTFEKKESLARTAFFGWGNCWQFHSCFNFPAKKLESTTMLSLSMCVLVS
jgi:hypothetical protein